MSAQSRDYRGLAPSLGPSLQSITDETNTTPCACTPRMLANMHTMCKGHESRMSMGRRIHACRHVRGTAPGRNHRADNGCKTYGNLNL